jgi:transposase-like protein
VAEAHGYVQEQEVVHVDETGWRQGRHRAWLWVMVSALVTVFLVHARRSTRAARSLIGDSHALLLVSDRWSAYKDWPIEQ